METKNKLREYLSSAKRSYSSVINEILDPEICNKYGWVVSVVSYFTGRASYKINSFVKRSKLFPIRNTEQESDLAKKL